MEPKSVQKFDDLVLTRIIAQKFNYPISFAECVTRDLLRDDFPANGVRTMSQALKYLDAVKATMNSRRPAQAKP